MSKNSRKSWIALSAAALLAGAAVLPAARAADDAAKTDDTSVKEAAMKCSAAMKQMAADPAKMDEAKTKMAKVMVMDKMSMMLAKDPEFQQKAMADMQDADMKKTHDAAKAMVDDPAQAQTMMSQIEADPEAMAIVTHNAAMMSAKPTKMGKKAKAKVDDAMKDMK